jgi:hypothetical protein
MGKKKNTIDSLHKEDILPRNRKLPLAAIIVFYKIKNG